MMDNSSSPSQFEQLVNLTGVTHGHFLPFLTFGDTAKLEQLSRECRRVIVSNKAQAWSVLYLRDFWEGLPTDQVPSRPITPIYSEERQSFDTLMEQDTWKRVYEKWLFYHRWTGGRVQSNHCIESIGLWRRLKKLVHALDLHDIVDNLLPCPASHMFQRVGSLPSELLALHSVHGGQDMVRRDSPDECCASLSTSLLGSFVCYDEMYAMRLLPFERLVAWGGASVTFATTLIGYRSIQSLSVNTSDSQRRGDVFMNISSTSSNICVGRNGVLAYLGTYTDRIEEGVYARLYHPFAGISLFASAGASLSCCVTNGIEVRASARWLPQHYPEAMRFAYHIRIRILPERSTPCQLLGRRWNFIDGNGRSHAVEGEGVIGKHPLFFVDDSGTSSYQDLGHHCDGTVYRGEPFTYVSQTGHIAGISIEDTKCAGASGSFSFVPGSIANPSGPPFDVTVGFFPFFIPFPFY